jgi:hypothetical protein
MQIHKITTVIAVLLTAAVTAADFETPAPEPASASLPPQLASGPNFKVAEPVESDGLMHHYVITSRFGDLKGYGQEALKIRVREIAALTWISKTNDVEVAARDVARGVKDQAKTVGEFVTHPVGTITGIPRGIGHLFSGFKAQANETVDSVKDSSGSGSDSGASTASRAAKTAKTDATHYADRYLGISAAERRYYKQLEVDPYTNNQVLRKEVHHLAKVDAAINVGMHFVGVPGVPYLSDVRRAMDAVYNEDPAVLRARQRKVLAGYGLSAAEIKQYENTLLLSPTRQSILAEVAKSLDGVAGRDELFRHAMSVTTEEEVEVFMQSAEMLARVHAHHPIARVVAGLRLPTGQTADGRIVVVGSFDAVYWTSDVAGYETALHAALDPAAKGLDLWLSGSISAQARTELTKRGWQVHDHALDALGDAPKPT